MLLFGNLRPVSVLKHGHSATVGMWCRSVGGVQGLFCSHLEALDAEAPVERGVAVCDEGGMHTPTVHDGAVEDVGPASVCREGFFILGFVGEEAGAWRERGGENGERFGGRGGERGETPCVGLAGADGVVERVGCTEGEEDNFRGDVGGRRWLS